MSSKMIKSSTVAVTSVANSYKTGCSSKANNELNERNSSVIERERVERTSDDNEPTFFGTNLVISSSSNNQSQRSSTTITKQIDLEEQTVSSATYLCTKNLKSRKHENQKETSMEIILLGKDKSLHESAAHEEAYCTKNQCLSPEQNVIRGKVGLYNFSELTIRCNNSVPNKAQIEERSSLLKELRNKDNINLVADSLKNEPKNQAHSTKSCSKNSKRCEASCKAQQNRVRKGGVRKTLSIKVPSHQRYKKSKLNKAKKIVRRNTRVYKMQAAAVRKQKSIQRKMENLQKKGKPELEKTEKSITLTNKRVERKLFEQNVNCLNEIIKLPKCLECLRESFRKSTKDVNHLFCRFIGYRKLTTNKNGTVLIAGFMRPLEATDSDKFLWLPNHMHPPEDLTIDTSRELLVHVGDQFCDLVQQEKEAFLCHIGSDSNVTWKKLNQGVRELCDVCDTTLFNMHWVCPKCGFAVCIDCYKMRRQGIVIEDEKEQVKRRDTHSWLFCHKAPHEQEQLIMAQMTPGNVLLNLNEAMHRVREKLNITAHCKCTQETTAAVKQNISDMICKPLMKVVNTFDANDNQHRSTNHLEFLKNDHTNDNQHRSTNHLEFLKNDHTNDNQHRSTNHLEFLKNDHTNDNQHRSTNHLEFLKNDHTNDNQHRSTNHLEFLKNDHTNSYAQWLYRTNEDDSRFEENFKKAGNADSDELMGFPCYESFAYVENWVNKAPNMCNSCQDYQPLSTLEMMKCLEESDEITNKKQEDQILEHFNHRYPQHNGGQESLPLRIFTSTESNVPFKNVSHSWLCNGRLLLLHYPDHPNNLKLFQEMWKRGQPIMVMGVNDKLDISLWHPSAFCADFGHIKNDLVDCKTGHIIPDLPMRRFWLGFEDFDERMKDNAGEPMLLKLKDWPPGEDFSEKLPMRFQDLMQGLPLPEYTHRDGIFNLAGRLPSWFVRPDLGPKMYNAYGSALYPSTGTTNLHLDISDAVNVMVYVGIPHDGKDGEHIFEALKAIDDGGCDSLVRERVRSKGVKPGALWHIYDSRHVDKIREFLAKIAIERGEEIEAHHDPIHDQRWYLDAELRKRLSKEYGVHGYAIAQCLGDAVFIPAGAPHQVLNLHSCVKVAEDFVSPENIAHCFKLTQEFRHLSHTHTNHEDKLQIKNIIYHVVKDALSHLMLESGC